MNSRRKRLVILLPRGEAVRNVVYTDTLAELSQAADITLFSVVTDDTFMAAAQPYVTAIHALAEVPENKVVRNLRALLHEAHFRWLNSEVAKYNREMHVFRARRIPARLRHWGTQGAARLLAWRPVLDLLARMENALTVRYCPPTPIGAHLAESRPDLVYNASHIHGVNGGGLAIRQAQQLGIPTTGFLFSWDNLTSRSRIFEPYDRFLVWHEPMQTQLRHLYPKYAQEDVIVTGTPQFDFHFKTDFWLSRDDLCTKLGLDPARPFVLYTTGVGPHFPEEVRTVQLVIQLLRELDLPQKPQLVVRIYPKAPDPGMLALAEQSFPDVVFPPMLWDLNWFTPALADQPIYTSLLRHCALGINAASTVSLELMMHDKPVINLGFDPPGSRLPHHLRFSKHITFDHYRPVAESGGVMVAWSPAELAEHLQRGLAEPDAGSQQRQRFIEEMFGQTLDGAAGRRVAAALLAQMGGTEHDR